MTNTKTGTLYIVSTPIGNLQDMSFRAIETLKTVHSIAAEDTRHSVPLLQYFGIKTPMISLHEHNEEERAVQLIHLLKTGESLALISDAGTPLVSDPGFKLVCHAHAEGIRVSPIPGPCAAIAALSVSGLPTDHFHFEGFLPVKTKSRLERLSALQEVSSTLIFYEAPHRIKDLMTSLQEAFGALRQATLAREMTKIFETIRTGTIAELATWVAVDQDQQRGEIVVVVEGSRQVLNQHESTLADELLPLLLAELPLKKAVEITEKITKRRKNELYEWALQLKTKKS